MSDAQHTQQVSALPDGGWVVTWASFGQDGSGYGIYQQTYKADGTKQGLETRVNTHVLNSQYGQQVTTLSDGGWVVTWVSSGQDGFGTGIYQQAYKVDGTTQGIETKVNTYTANEQTDPRITALSGGGWVVTWTSDGVDGSATAICQQVYNANGTARGGQTLVNTYNLSIQYGQQVTALSDGGWVVTWISIGQDGSATGIYQQAYKADGTPQGGETPVNSHTIGEQSNPRVTALSDGGWVVTWVSAEQDGSGYGVYQQAYDADGTAHGPETRINIQTENDQRNQKVTALPDGAWVVTWESYREDGTRDVHQRFFWLNDAPTVENAIDDRTATEDQPFSFAFDASTFADADIFDTLSYSATLSDSSALPDWLHFNATTRTFSGTPQNGDVGTVTIKVTATDTGGASISDTFTLTVENVNDAPILPVDADAWTFENASVPIDVLAAARDDDGDPLTIVSASVLSGFGSVFVEDGRLVYDPTTAPNQNIAADETRTVVIRYSVADDQGGTTTADVTVTVKGVSPDVFKGTPGNDSLKGSIHGDILYGYAGNDTLDGDTGADQMYGGKGNDTYLVDHEDDTPFEKSGEGIDLVRSSVSHTLSANVENLTLTGRAKIDATGNGLANTLIGNGVDNVLNGGRNADALRGGKGNDTYLVDNIGDTVTEKAKAKEGTDLVRSSVSHTLSANVENLTLTGRAKIDATGNGLANVLIGNGAGNTLDGGGGADTLQGGAGTDRLIGGAGGGADKLYGGAGADTFVFTQAQGKAAARVAANHDVIFDFTRRQGDRIDLQAIDADARSGTDDGFTFIGKEKFHKVAGELRYEKKDGKTAVLGDVDGDGRADFAITIGAALDLARTDFLL